MEIYFFNEGSSYTIPEKVSIKKWIKDVIRFHNKIPGYINFIFVSKEEIWRMNLQYLNHDYYTDIITFDYGHEDEISGDMYICPDIVHQNAEMLGKNREEEILRVLVHGILHLIGYDDKEESEKESMRLKEDECLRYFKKP